MMKHKYNISKLNDIYTQGEAADQDLFAEQRSNILLIAGEHYARKTSKNLSRLRDSRDLQQEQKLRIVKNYTQKATKILRNNILQYSPGVTIVPKQPKDIQHQKQAQLNKSVWHDAKVKHKMTTLVQDWVQDYVDIGELAVKIFWDPYAGKFKGWEAQVDDEGNVEYDEQGQMVPSERPVFTGDFVIERIFGFNLIRSRDTKKMGSDGKCMVYRKMVDISDLKDQVRTSFEGTPELEEKLRYITETQDKTYVVFDNSKMGYGRADGQCLLREFHFRPGYEFPNGYYFITTENGILWEGEHPFGIYPIIYTGWDASQTSPRHHGVVKQIRPVQVEINRTASKIAETQCTSDDKIITQAGAKMSQGGQLPGIRAVQISGAAPTILEGRSGEQYLPYLQAQIPELDILALLPQDSEEKATGQDPFGNLFLRLKQKKKFALYGEKFQEFQVTFCETYLKLAKQYLPDDMLIPILGKSEYVNIQEFKNTTDLCYQIEVEPMSDDIESMMGKQLIINHALQYVGSQLGKDDIGKLMRAMPLGDFDEGFSDLTIDYDLSQNMILALDRGEQPRIFKYDNPDYLLKKLTSRMRMPDFPMLNQQIQSSYEQVVSHYEEQKAQQQQELLAQQADFIPSGGARIKVDYYIQDPTNKDRTVRATIPAESVDWLIKRLGDQGTNQQALAAQNPAVAGEIGNMVHRPQPGVGQPPQQAGAPLQNIRPQQGSPLIAPSGMPPKPSSVIPGL